MKTTYGTRASICAHFHWTLDYLENGISWAKVLRMMADLPEYDYDSEDEKQNLSSFPRQTKDLTEITEQNADDLLKMFKR